MIVLKMIVIHLRRRSIVNMCKLKKAVLLQNDLYCDRLMEY